MSSTNLKKKIYDNYEKMRNITDNHLPFDAETHTIKEKGEEIN